MIAISSMRARTSSLVMFTVLLFRVACKTRAFDTLFGRAGYAGDLLRLPGAFFRRHLHAPELPPSAGHRPIAVMQMQHGRRWNVACDSFCKPWNVEVKHAQPHRSGFAISSLTLAVRSGSRIGLILRCAFETCFG